MWKWGVLAGLLAAANLAASPAHAANPSPAQQQTKITVWENGAAKQLMLRGADRYEVKWQFQPDADFYSDVVRDEAGVMYVTTENGVLYALDESGKVKWRTDLQLDWSEHIALGRDGHLYVLADNTSDYDKEPGWIYAADKSGRLLWRMELPSMYSEYDRVFEVDSKGTMYLLTDAGISAVDSEGKLLWSNKDMVEYEYGAYLRSNVRDIRLHESSGTLFVRTTADKLYAIDTNGKTKWTRSSVSYVDEYVVSPEGNLYFLAQTGVSVINGIDGTDMKEAPTDPQTLTRLGIPHDQAGGIFFVTKQGALQKMDRTGKVLWTYWRPKGQTGSISTEPVSDSEGNVYFADSGGSLYGLDKQGKEKFVLIRNNPMYLSTQVWLGRNGMMMAAVEGIGLLAINSK